MIKARFDRDASGDIAHFLITGHADSGDFGHDIVCAAVSAVSIGAVNGIESLAGFEPDVQADEVNGGHLDVAFDKTVSGEQHHIAQLLLENLLLSLQSIAEQYGDYVTITTRNS
ncbi:ribosomal-processing cysteine protease Prp [Lacticaseibacillus mingshuiensis]|uniref:Ribosomal processing cysteine protease Prp n=1 Tax=Lacticaseibacillus mingshuiensis TaxID=2799574 RepID=A0ABW4CGI2_9LACO|nr:ribosomal-processing cysteine protease Prp [Lacticaseibacillus mingshuiensis]